MPLQGDPPPSHDIERGDTQTEKSSARNGDKDVKPGELARVVHSDPIVRVVPMQAGWESSTIEVKRSALPKAHYQSTVLGSWIVILYVLIWSNCRFLFSDGWHDALLLATLFSPICQVVIPLFELKLSLLLPILLSINVLCVTIFQLVVTVVCYREEKEYFGGTLFALIAMVLYGSFTVFVVYSHRYEAGEAALAAVAAAESGTAGECSESHALSALSYSQPTSTTAQDPEQSVQPSQSCPQSSQVADLGTVRIVRHDPIIKVVPFDGDWESSCIIVRRSVLPLKLRRMALLLHLIWAVNPYVVLIAGLAASVSGYCLVLASGLPMASVISLFQLITLDSCLDTTGPEIILYFVKFVVFTVAQQLAITVAFYHGTQAFFAQNLCVIVLLVLFGMLSTAVVYQYHYRSAQAALDALAAESAKSSLAEDDDSHERDSTSK